MIEHVCMHVRVREMSTLHRVPCHLPRTLLVSSCPVWTIRGKGLCVAKGLSPSPQKNSQESLQSLFILNVWESIESGHTTIPFLQSSSSLDPGHLCRPGVFQAHCGGGSDYSCHVGSNFPWAACCHWAVELAPHIVLNWRCPAPEMGYLSFNVLHLESWLFPSAPRR